MNRRRIGFVLIGAGVIIALLVGVLVFLQANEAEQLRQAAPKRWVAVAGADIPERTTITGDQVRTIQLPDDAVPPGAASFLPDSGMNDEQIGAQRQNLVAQIRDQFTTSRIYRGEVFNRERLGREALKNNPSFELPPGRVAFAFPVRVTGGTPPNERVLLGFLNAVRPGDFVDIYYSSIEIPSSLTREEQERQRLSEAQFLYTRRIMQNIKVLNIGFFPDREGKAAETPRDERYLTLQVSPDEALTLKWVKDVASLTGNVDFVLRSPVDTADFPQQTVSFEMMATRYGIGTGR